jgi:heat shock protein HtpX
MLHRIANNLRVKAGLPVTPALYVIPSETPNAFATGRNPSHAAIAVTEGILRIRDEEELEGVLAHELAHVKNRDILTSSIAATLAGAIMMIASMARWAMIFGGGQRDDRDGQGPLELSR